ncbi:asparaginase [Oceanobacillus halotolerans]|uniref:asparaginase n=1 Tax=Oceanobacillus halotolerans TaxID=2663380 RepID=UPI0013DC9CC3|nr:asparaginase [Oceanobacillus halotolerans]
MTQTKPIQVFRGDYLESAHDIHIAVVNANGELIASFGEQDRLTFARSSMKPFQAVPIVESGAMDGFALTEKELALFCASHNGEPFHRESVTNVLEKLNLQEEHLQCGTHIPKDIESYNQLIKEGGQLTPLYSNCSGKHSGMLAGCMQQDMDISTYRDVTHPYQQQIIEVIANVSDYEKDKINTSVDGCGVPVHRLPLENLALAFARLANPDQWEEGDTKRKSSLKRIRNAMVEYPEMVAGTKRFDTDLMGAYAGRIVAKGGAEGVHCFGDSETGIGVAVKVDDGNARATSVASMQVLQQLDIGEAALRESLISYDRAPVLNARNEKIGEIKPSFSLNVLNEKVVF